jgi:hypothetical protein
MEIYLLNHACVVISFRNGVKILTDPWLKGLCFSEGWGLYYENIDAWNLVTDCTHLWISHFHEDHFHLQTLTELLVLNPNITVLGNNSYNFKLDNALKHIGFKNIISLYELKTIKLDGDNLVLTRFPASGIDNMLFLESNEGNVLNYNDCNLPRGTINKLITNKIKNIDILLISFNHASKMLEQPPLSDTQVKDKYLSNFKRTVNLFAPKYTIPFASFHYYRSPEGINQNSSLLSNTDLLEEKTVVPVMIGQSIKFDEKIANYKLSENSSKVLKTIRTTKSRKRVALSELIYSSKKFVGKFNYNYLYLTIFIKTLIIKVTDLNVLISINIFPSNITIRDDIDIKSVYHLSAESEEIYKWFSSKNGTDTFLVGCHFNVTSKVSNHVNIILLLSLLIENKLSLRYLVKMLFSFKGIIFLINRKSEIFSIIANSKLKIGIRS